jgi:hypothetical protein
MTAMNELPSDLSKAEMHHEQGADTVVVQVVGISGQYHDLTITAANFERLFQFSHQNEVAARSCSFGFNPYHNDNANKIVQLLPPPPTGLYLTFEDDNYDMNEECKLQLIPSECLLQFARH